MTTDPNLCRVTLLGPVQEERKRTWLQFKFKPQPEWRRLVIEIQVGSDRWPTWERANICLTAIKDLITLNDGYLNDAVVQALGTHVNVVSYQTFRGPPDPS